MNERNTESKQQAMPVVLGGSSLLVIFAVLCLTIFALLGLSTAQADKRLSDASVQSVTAYYQADTQAEEIFARLRTGITDTKEGKEGLPDGVICKGDLYQYSCPISETQTLWVELKKDGQNWTVLRWQAVANSRPHETQPEVWDGNTTS